MLFNSYVFLFAFLPATFCAFWLLQRSGRTQIALSLLLLCSLGFYSYWNPPFLLLLLGSILFNHFIGRAIWEKRSWRGISMAIGIGGNIGLLAYFKYSNFGIDIVNRIADTDIPALDLFLPLGISFFTFQQIIYLSDIYFGKLAPARLRDYALFISFFPHLLAGPITQPREILPQIENYTGGARFWDNLLVGLSLFIMGLFKKVIVADKLALYANPVFSDAAKGKDILFFDGWMGALGYTFQLYFDFSGYSDMALGLGLMFGILMPINFLSPYKSTSIIDFWRHWHMTMSRFFRDYIYIPLGGARVSAPRQLGNLFVTMALAGLWHGAGWTFIAWGVLHGAYLVVNHLYRRIRLKILPGMQDRLWHRLPAHLLTMLAVVVGWVFFRAESFDSAFAMLRAMFGFNGIVVPEKLSSILPFLSETGPIRYSEEGRWHRITAWAAPAILAAYLFCVAMPSSMEFFRLAETDSRSRFRFQTRRAYALLFAVMAVIVVFNMQRISEFLYFQF
jgi:alginate O-acetyltransferase complex protein AlgI